MDKTKHHFTFQERVMLSDLLVGDYMKKTNGKPNISKIAEKMHKNRNTIRREIKIKIFDEYNNLIIEDRILINDIMNNLKDNNILPKEIIINTDDISFEGSFLVTKVNNSDYYVKTEEIDTI